MSADHATFDELAVGWALHSLEPEDEAIFTAHLAGCDRCARTVAETIEMMASLASDLPPAEPSVELRSRLRAAVERTEQVPAELASARRAVATGFPDYDGGHRRAAGAVPVPRWRRSLPTLLAAAAVALIFALGVWNVVLNESRGEAEATAQAQARIVAELLTPGRATIAPVADKGGNSVATVVARPDDVVVVTHGLQINNATDSIYVVWGMESDKAVALGTFDVVHAQMDLRPVGSSGTGLDDYPQYGISLEAGRQAPPKPTDVVATGAVIR